MIEYLIGGSKPKQNLTPNSVPTSSILFSENYSKIIFHMYNEGNIYDLCAIEIDNDIIIGTKNENCKSLEIIFENNIPQFDSMEIQEVIKQACDNKSLYWSSITYLQIIYNGNEYILGEKKPIGMVKLNDNNNVLLEYDFLPSIRVNNPFIISGIISHNASICSIQIVEFNGKFDIFNEKLFYNRGVYGIIEGSNVSGEFELKTMVMNHNVVSLENIKTIQLLQLLYDRMAGWTFDKSVITTYYAKFLSLIDEAMIEREFDVIHSIFRIDRYLKSLIQRKDLEFCHNKKYQHNLGLTTKMYNVWKPLSNTMELIQHIHDADLELNCYQIAYLSKNKRDLLYAIFTIITQISLLLLLGLSLLEVNVDSIFPLYEGRVIIPIIFIFTLFIVQKQISNTLNFIKLFPTVKYTFLGMCDLFSNVCCAGLVILLNFFILAFSDSLIDIVLNSLAALFIVELDDAMVFISSNSKDDLYKQKVISYFNKLLKQIDPLYFSSSAWKHHGIFKLVENDFEVNRELCIITKKNNIVSNNISDAKTVPDIITINIDNNIP